MRSHAAALSFLAIAAIVVAACLPFPGRTGTLSSYASAADARCKTVIKRVHGHRKKVRVCKKAAPTPTPTPVAHLSAHPSDLVVAPGGNILVAVQAANQVLTLSPEGKPLSVWTTAGTNPISFGQLYGIALDSAGNIYVTDARDGVVDKLDPSGHPLAQLSTEAAIAHSFPTLLAVGPTGDLYVSSHGAEAVLHLSPSGALVGLIGKGEFEDPYGVAFGSNGNLYVTDFMAGRVREYTPDGKGVAVWGDGANGTVNLAAPEAIALDPAGNIYVSEQAGLIVKFDQTGHLLAQWGNDGSLSFDDPSGLALDAVGNIYVAEYEGNRVDKLSPTGQLLATWP
jgi:DNA-binding beta-propeller fold protein YncE